MLRFKVWMRALTAAVVVSSLVAGPAKAEGVPGDDVPIDTLAGDLLILFQGTLDDLLTDIEDTSATCNGLPATIVGTNSGEPIQGTPQADVIQARGGADTVTGLGGDDVICGGGGGDEISAGTGADYVRGGDGADTIEGGVAGDRLFGNELSDSIRGGRGDDGVVGRLGNDFLYDGFGNDVLAGEGGTDHFFFCADGEADAYDQEGGEPEFGPNSSYC